MQRQTRHLRHIVDDLLEMSRMQSVKIVLEARPLDLSRCVRSCVDALRSTDRAQGRRLIVEADEVWVDGDPLRLEQIVNNLVVNALKFSAPPRAVRIRVERRGDAAVIEVGDSGAGRPSSGLGIGLALVKQLVALHGGAIQATSAGEGAGSTFTATCRASSGRRRHRRARPVRKRRRAASSWSRTTPMRAKRPPSCCASKATRSRKRSTAIRRCASSPTSHRT